jgi:hypothetical protein
MRNEEAGIDPHLDFLCSKYFLLPNIFPFPNPLLAFLRVRGDFESVFYSVA